MTGRFWVFTEVSPAGFEQAFLEMSEFMARGDQPPDMERLLTIARKYNLRIINPR